MIFVFLPFVIGATMTVALWLIIQRWRPRRRWIYVARYTLYGALPGAYFMGRAIVSGRVADGLAGWWGLWFLLLPVTVSIGAVLSAKRLGQPRVR